MVTIDNTLYAVKEFSGDLEAGKRDYDRAQQGAERIKKEMSTLEERLKAHTGYDKLNLPQPSATTMIVRGDVKIEIKSEKRTKKPAYKEAACEMERYLNGINFLLSEGRTITGVVKEGKKTYIGITKLVEAYEVMVAGVTVSEVKHTIRWDSEIQAVDELVLTGKSTMTAENFEQYAKMDMMLPAMKTYVKAYETKLTKDQRSREKVTAVTSKSALKSTKTTSKGPNWKYVVTNIVEELDELASESSKAEKERELPFYDLIYKANKRLFVSLQSVYDRIQDLKEGQSITSKRLKVEPKEVV